MDSAAFIKISPACDCVCRALQDKYETIKGKVDALKATIERIKAMSWKDLAKKLVQRLASYIEENSSGQLDYLNVSGFEDYLKHKVFFNRRRILQLHCCCSLLFAARSVYATVEITCPSIVCRVFWTR